MDFGIPLRREPSTATLANICHIPSDAIADELEERVIRNANAAAADLLQVDPSTGVAFPSTSYPRFTYDRTKFIKTGQLVVIFESFDSLTFAYATPGAVHHNKNGDFYHDDFIDKLSFGAKLRARNHGGYGYVYLLRPTSELWARSLPHRTQIVYELDSSTVIFQLNIKPNMVVLESGTGSGAMSTAIMRTIAPHGRLHTYEFNGVRAQKARDEFKRNKIDHLVTVHHKDVCGKAPAGLSTVNNISSSSSDNGSDNEKVDMTMESCEGDGGFGVGGQVADAIFLDLPEPWLAVPHAAFAIKPNHRLCSYSPCIEQAQKCIVALKENGFHSIKTIEVRLREHYVDEVDLELPPTAKVVRVDKDEMKLMEEDEANEFYRKKKLTKVPQSTSSDMTDSIAPELSTSTDAKNGQIDKVPNKRKKVCARPFAVMKGHTAFLTFATAGLAKRTDPNEQT